MKTVTSDGIIHLSPKVVDEIVLAENTSWECKVSRLLPAPSVDSLLFCALVEEIKLLKEKIKILEKPDAIITAE